MFSGYEIGYDNRVMLDDTIETPRAPLPQTLFIVSDAVDLKRIMSYSIVRKGLVEFRNSKRYRNEGNIF